MDTSRRRRRARRIAPLAVAGALLLTVPVVHADVKNNPENKSLPPSANPGYFLGYPTGTYSWHGCTATATKASLADRIPGAPALAKGSHQRAVTFTVRQSAPYVSWQVKDGWTICGVQASAQLSNKDVDADLLAEIGYTSGRKKGSTAKDGKETIRVPIAKKAIDRAEFEQYEGKTFSIVQLQDVTVYIKRLKK